MWIACASCGSIAKGLMLNTYQINTNGFPNYSVWQCHRSHFHFCYCMGKLTGLLTRRSVESSTSLPRVLTRSSSCIQGCGMGWQQVSQTRTLSLCSQTSSTGSMHAALQEVCEAAHCAMQMSLLLWPTLLPLHPSMNQIWSQSSSLMKKIIKSWPQLPQHETWSIQCRTTSRKNFTTSLYSMWNRLIIDPLSV